MKKLLKKALSVSLFTGIIFSCFVFTSVAASSPSVSLVDIKSHKAVSAVTLYGNADYLCFKCVGNSKTKTFTLKMYSDSAHQKLISSLSWNYSDGKTHYNNVAVELSDLKSATYYGTVKIGSQTKSFKFTVNRKGTAVKSSRPVLLGYNSTTAGTYILWYTVPNAKSYTLYRYNSEKKEYVKFKTVKENSTEGLSYYVDTTTNVNGSYTYKVAASDGKNTSVKSYNSAKVYYKKAVTGVKCAVKPNNLVEISWDSCGSGVKYGIYLYSKFDDNYKKLGTTSKTSFSYSPGKTGYYTFVVISESSTALSMVTDKSMASVSFLKSVTKIEASSGKDKIELTWKTAEDADEYSVYRKDYSGGKYSRIGTTTNGSYTDTDVEPGKSYRYTVKYKLGNSYSSYSSSGAVGACVPAPSIKSIIPGKRCVTFTLGEMPDNICYRISCSQRGDDYSVTLKPGKNTVTLKETDFCTNYTRAKFDVGETVTFIIRTYAYDSGCTYPIPYSEETTFFYPLSPNLVHKENGNELSWVHDYWGHKKECVDEHIIYRSEDGVNYTEYARTVGTVFKDTDIAPNKEYSYKVDYVVNGVPMNLPSEPVKIKQTKKYVNAFNGEIYTSYNKNNSWYKSFGIADLSSDENIDGVEIWKYVVTATNQKNEEIEPYWIKLCDVQPGKNEVKVTYEADCIDTVIRYKDGSVSALPDTPKVYKKYIGACNTESDSDNKILKLSWRKIPEADYYFVYRDGKLLATVTEENYNDKTLAYDKCYCYTFKAVVNNVVCNIDLVAYCAVASTPVVKPVNVPHGIKLTWGETRNEISRGVRIYRKTADSSWKRLTEFVNSDSFTDTTAVEGTKYYYLVKRVVSFDNQSYLSAGKTSEPIIYYKAPELTGIENTSKGVKIKWKSSKTADEFYVYRKSDSGSWKKIQTLSGKTFSYTDKSAPAGKKCTYTVKSKIGSYYSGYITKGISITYLKAPAVKATKVKGGIKISFNKTASATGYYVYRKAQGASSYSKIATLKGNTNVTYTDKSVSSGKKYTYIVKAYNGGTVSGYNTGITV